MAASVRLTKAAEQWEHALRGDVAPGTIRIYMSTMRIFIRVVGDLYVRSLTPRHIDQFFTANSHWQPSTRNRQRLALSAFFKWCRTRGYLDKTTDPLEGRRKPTIPKKKRTRLTPAQVEEMLENTKDPRDRIAAALGVYLGLRISEILRIRWGDFTDDFTRVRIIRSKKGGAEEDIVAVRGRLRAELKRWQVFICRHMNVVRPKEDWYVACSKRTNAKQDERGRWYHSGTGYDPTRSITPQSGGRAIKKVLATIGVTEKGEASHALRRTGADIIVRQVNEMGGDGLRVAQLQLGHKDRSTTEIYLDVDRDRDLRDQYIAALDDDGPEDQGPGAEILVLPTRKVEGGTKT